MNAHTEDWIPHWLDDTETAWQWFLNDCSNAGPALCPIAKHTGEKPQDIESRLFDFVDKLWFSGGLPIVDTARPGVLTSGQARSMWTSIASLSLLIFLLRSFIILY